MRGNRIERIVKTVNFENLKTLDNVKKRLRIIEVSSSELQTSVQLVIIRKKRKNQTNKVN